MKCIDRNACILIKGGHWLGMRRTIVNIESRGCSQPKGPDVGWNVAVTVGRNKARHLSCITRQRFYLFILAVVAPVSKGRVYLNIHSDCSEECIATQRVESVDKAGE
jgi:hypothetical protein